jgi:hypothetical protein
MLSVVVIEVVAELRLEQVSHYAIMNAVAAEKSLGQIVRVQVSGGSAYCCSAWLNGTITASLCLLANSPGMFGAMEGIPMMAAVALHQ